MSAVSQQFLGQFIIIFLMTKQASFIRVTVGP